MLVIKIVTYREQGLQQRGGLELLQKKLIEISLSF